MEFKYQVTLIGRWKGQGPEGVKSVCELAADSLIMAKVIITGNEGSDIDGIQFTAEGCVISVWNAKIPNPRIAEVDGLLAAMEDWLEKNPNVQ